VKTIRILLFYLVLSLTIVSCGKTGGSSGAQSGDKAKASGQQQQNGSVIDQELNKQTQIYQEILQHQKKQEEKVKKESQDRYKMLEEQSNKPQESNDSGNNDKSQDKKSGDQSADKKDNQ
jgi:hypothetical protein